MVRLRDPNFFAECPDEAEYSLATVVTARRRPIHGNPNHRGRGGSVAGDRAHRTSVAIAPSIGNIAFEMLVNGHNLLWFPYSSVGAFRDKPRIVASHCSRPGPTGSMRALSTPTVKRNIHRNPDLGNIRLDGAGHPILDGSVISLTSEWQVLRVEADSRYAFRAALTSLGVLSGCQFPFAHTIEITHTLADGVLEISTRVENRSAEPMPLSIGYHLSTRSPTRLAMIGRSASPRRGSGQSIRNFFPRAKRVRSANLFRTPRISAWKGLAFDNVLEDLIRDSAGRASFWIKGKRQKIEVSYGLKYIAGEFYAPPKRDFVCFEPMAGIDNAINLSHRGVYSHPGDHFSRQGMARKLLDSPGRVLDVPELWKGDTLNYFTSGAYSYNPNATTLTPPLSPHSPSRENCTQSGTCSSAGQY